MKKLFALATLSLALSPVNSFAGESSPAPSTAAPTPGATASSAAPTPNPDTMEPELADGLIDCRLEMNQAMGPKPTETPIKAATACYNASFHYTELASKEANEKQAATDLACKYGVNAAVTADVADWIVAGLNDPKAPAAQIHQFAKDATTAITSNGCKQQFIDEATKAYESTHKTETKST